MAADHFVVQAGDVFFVCQPVQYAQPGRSHRVIAECASDHDAWDIARALNSFVKDSE